jgi:hypothetical protein
MLKLTLIFAAIHLLVFMTALFASLTGLGEFDSPFRGVPWFETLGEISAKILGFPLMTLWQHFQLGKILPDALEWTALFVNSLLWGFTLAFLVAKSSSDKSN